MWGKRSIKKHKRGTWRQKCVRTTGRNRKKYRSSPVINSTLKRGDQVGEREERIEKTHNGRAGHSVAIRKGRKQRGEEMSPAVKGGGKFRIRVAFPEVQEKTHERKAADEGRGNGNVHADFDMSRLGNNHLFSGLWD